MKIFNSIFEWMSFRKEIKETLGFVPTMGALHEGHLALMKEARKQNKRTLVSIFVNPTQFNDPKDLQGYPRTLEEDIQKLEVIGVDYLLLPTFEELYPDHYRYELFEKEFSQELCGKSRPGHFNGVLTVVMKLLNIAEAQKAYFGEKDYQQLELIQSMVKTFFVKTEIIPCPIVREADGLAMSSRNVKLSSEGRKKAPSFYRILKGASHPIQAKAQLEEEGFKVDYVEEKMGRRFGAIYLDGVRLIDNVQI